MPDLRDAIWQRCAAHFPTRLVSRSRLLRGLWRALFYGVAPRLPFVLDTRWYPARVDPRRKGYIGRTLLLSGAYEPRSTEVFAREVKGCMRVLDIGANFGHYSLVASNLLPEDARVHAFEPEPGCFSDLDANRAIQPAGNLRVHNLALGDRVGRVDLHVDAANFGGHSLGAGNVAVLARTISVEMRTIDSLVAEWGDATPVDFLRMDAQGAELRILAGARATIERFRPKILMEFWPTGLRAMGSDPEELVRFVRERGYTIFRIDGRSLPEDGPVSVLEMERLEFTDLLCLPEPA